MNLMLTNFCNLHCAYCFAEDSMVGSEQEMTIENFKYCLDFLKQEDIEQVNLIGGEPTLHSRFVEVLDLIKEYGFLSIQLFTNGIFGEKVLKKLIDIQTDLTALINVNSPDVIGVKKYHTMRSNIEKLRGENRNVVLGVNIFKPDMKLDFFKSFVEELQVKRIRWSVAVPGKMVKDTSAFYSEYKSIVLQFLEWAYEKRLHTTCDCNRIPLCVWEDKELRLLAVYEPEVLSFKQCSPVFDVKPNLDVIRCFGTGDKYVCNLKKYTSLRTMHVDFVRNVDLPSLKKITDSKCLDCSLFKNKECRKACISML